MQMVVISEKAGIRTVYGPFADAREAAAFRNAILDPRTCTETENSIHALFSPEQAPRDPGEIRAMDMRRALLRRIGR